MQRRDFHKGAVSTAVLALLGVGGCGGGGGDGGAAAGTGTPTGPGVASAGGSLGDVPAAGRLVTMGTNLSGMEWAFNVRSTPNTAPNLNITVPRAAEVRWLAVNGFGKNRLPFMWELLQPMLSDTVANAQARALIGEPGAFHEGYARYIDSVLDAHAAAGTRCILDCHNYCRYRDFRFHPDGSVIGLTRPADPTLHAYTTDGSQVFTRIMATAPGATLRPGAFADFWRRAALRWKDHPGFGGYGLMNEPHDMPRPGQTEESVDGGDDLMIWPQFARAAIDAIRAVDANGVIYLSGNLWGGAMNIGPHANPAWPLAATNLIYEVHAYVDAWNNGRGFDWDLEVAKNYRAGFGPGPVTLDTGVDRMRMSTEWARAHNTRVALTETGMPIDDRRWHEAFRRLVEHSWQNGAEIQTWIGGSHWAARNAGMHHVPGWHQNRALDPQVAGFMQAAAGIERASLFDDGPGWSADGSPITITVYARGNLVNPVTLTVASSAGGNLSKTTLVIPAGANGEDSFTFTPAPGTVTTLTYQATNPASRQVPPPRKVYSLADPVAHAGTHLADAALAILARYSACKWDLADGYTDYALGRPAQEGEEVRAVADSGFGSSPGNAMEMVNSMNQDVAGMGPLRPPVMRTAGRKRSDHTADGSTGLWCRKTVPWAEHPAPVNRAPYHLQDSHFAVAAVALPSASASGTVFQATEAGHPGHVALAVSNGQAQARWRDAGGQTLVLTGPQLATNAPVVLALSGRQGEQQLRVNSAVVGSGGSSFGRTGFGDLLIGWGDPLSGSASTFRGHVYAVITGPGTPTPAELGVLERYLGALAA